MPHIHTISTWSGLLLAGCLSATAVGAQSHDMTQHATGHATTATAAAAHTQTPPAHDLPWVDAEVRRVDKSAGKVTLKHAEITNLDMPGMTMVFAVQDPSQLAQLQAGDAVQFTASKVNGQYVLVSLRPLPSAPPVR